MFEKLTKHGLNVVEYLDDGKVVLALTTNEEISVKSVKVDAVPWRSEDNSRSKYRGPAGQVPEVHFEWLKKDLCVSLKDNLRADNQDQKFFGDFFFQAAHGREGDTRWVRLVLMECSFGVEGCFNEDNQRGWFVYKSWRDGKRFKLEKPSSFVLGALPELPRNYDPNAFAQGRHDFVADASWRIPNMSEEDLGNVEWDIVIQLHFAHVKKGWNFGPIICCLNINFSMEFNLSVKLDL
ncbi:unnamed protein product [Sphagnum tenellum]